MRSTLLLVLALCVSTALVEFCVLQRWFGRRSLRACIGSVAVTSGVFWLAFAVALSWVEFGWKTATEPAMIASEMLVVGCLFLLDAALLSIVALIPAGLVAAIYRRVKCQP